MRSDRTNCSNRSGGSRAPVNASATSRASRAARASARDKGVWQHTVAMLDAEPVVCLPVIPYTRRAPIVRVLEISSELTITVSWNDATGGNYGAQIWRIRHLMSEVQKLEGGSIKHDVAVPVGHVPELLARAAAAVTLIMAARKSEGPAPAIQVKRMATTGTAAAAKSRRFKTLTRKRPAIEQSMERCCPERARIWAQPAARNSRGIQGSNSSLIPSKSACAKGKAPPVTFSRRSAKNLTAMLRTEKINDEKEPGFKALAGA